MPSQTQQSQMPDDPEIGNLLQKHAKDKMVKPNANLPGGIKGGVARLIEARLGKYQKGVNKDKTFLYLAGNVLDPEYIEDKGRQVKVRGRRTSQTLALCATTGKKQDENVQTALNHMKLLGGQNCTLNVKKLGDLDALGKLLVSKSILFGFETRESDKQTKPDPKNPGKTITFEARVWETWLGADEVPHDYQAPKPQGMTPAATNGKHEVQEAAEESPDEETTTESENDSEGSTDTVELPGDNRIDELVEQADSGNEEARAELTALGVQIGETTEEIEGADLWSDVGEWIREARGSSDEEKAPEEEAAPEEPEVRVPKVGEVWKVKLLVKNTKGALVKSKNYTECKIKSISKDTCTITDLATKKEIKGIKLDSLEEN